MRVLLQVTVALGRQAEGYGCVGSGKSSPFGGLVPVDLFGSRGNGLLGTGLLSNGLGLSGSGGLLNLGGPLTRLRPSPARVWSNTNCHVHESAVAHLRVGVTP